MNMDSYYEQPTFEPFVMAHFTKGNITAEILQLDADGESFCANTYSVDDEGYENYLNNSGSVSSFMEALTYFTWDLDCFLDGTDYDPNMLTIIGRSVTNLH